MPIYYCYPCISYSCGANVKHRVSRDTSLRTRFGARESGLQDGTEPQPVLPSDPSLSVSACHIRMVHITHNFPRRILTPLVLRNDAVRPASI